MTETKIYKIFTPLGDEIYIGSTASKLLSTRFSHHKANYRSYIKRNKTKGFITLFLMFEKYGMENCFIELVEEFISSTIDERRMKEGDHIRATTCINKCYKRNYF